MRDVMTDVPALVHFSCQQNFTSPRGTDYFYFLIQSLSVSYEIQFHAGICSLRLSPTQGLNGWLCGRRGTQTCLSPTVDREWVRWVEDSGRGAGRGEMPLQNEPRVVVVLEI